MGANITDNTLNSDEQILQSMLNALRALYYLQALEKAKKNTPHTLPFYAAKNAFEKNFGIESYHDIEHQNIPQKILDDYQKDIDHALDQYNETSQIESWSIQRPDIASTKKAISHLKAKLIDYSMNTTGIKKLVRIALYATLACISLIIFVLALKSSAVAVPLMLVIFPAVVFTGLYSKAITLVVDLARSNSAFAREHNNNIIREVNTNIQNESRLLVRPSAPPHELTEDNPQHEHSHVGQPFTNAYPTLVDARGAPPPYTEPSVGAQNPGIILQNHFI